MLSTNVSLRSILFLVAPLISGAIALGLGMDASWDLRNYHYYNGWALLHGHVDRDLLVAQTPSFYNPLLDLPFAWAAEHLDARVLAFLLGGLQGGNFILLTLLGERLLDFPPRCASRLALLLAATGCCGAVALSEIGTVFYDNVTSLGLFASLLMLVRTRPLHATGGGTWRTIMAGLPVGLAFGLKQTMIPFPFGLAVGLLLTAPGRPQSRLKICLAFALGVTVATAAGGGFWMLHLWQLYGNPLFPYFNQIFHSSWGQAGDYRDVHFAPHGMTHWLLFPLYVAFDSRLASEVDFRDFRLAALFVTLPVTLAMRAPLRPGVALLLVSSAVSYLVWLLLFDIYRYLVGLEMLAPLLLALILQSWLPVWRWQAIFLTMVALLVTTRPAEWIRVPFRPRAVEVTLPAIADPENSLVLLAGHEPLSFLLPAFPVGMVFLRIDSTFTNPDQTDVPFNRVMRERILRHRGPLLALYIPSERHDVVKRLGDDGLVLAQDGCAAVTSPIGAADYALCPVLRP